MAKAGDTVEIKTKKATYKGTLLPRPELLSQDTTVLKLESGYNIGIATKTIENIKVIEKYKKKEKPKQKLSKNKNLPNVAILSVGGTIASRVDYITGGVYADYQASDFIAMCPELEKAANIKAVNVMKVMSEDILPQDWAKIARAVAKTLQNVEGVVITHGTDTMHYTSAALSFLLEGLDKPVILTGAQRSIDRPSSDAFMNLACAVHAASKLKHAGVAICMHAESSDTYCNLIPGVKARKMHTSRRDAFRPMGVDPLARVWPEGRIEHISTKKPPENKKLKVNSCKSEISLIEIHPSIDPSIITKQLGKVRGMIIAATALGHVPLNNPKSLETALKKACKKIPVFICSQTLYGRVHPHVYASLRKLSMDIGATFLEDMLPETALAKLSVALTKKNPKKYMTENIAGEITEREKYHTFLQ